MKLHDRVFCLASKCRFTTNWLIVSILLKNCFTWKMTVGTLNTTLSIALYFRLKSMDWLESKPWICAIMLVQQYVNPLKTTLKMNRKTDNSSEWEVEFQKTFFIKFQIREKASFKMDRIINNHLKFCLSFLAALLLF